MVHVLYNLHSMSLEKSLASVLILKTGPAPSLALSASRTHPTDRVCVHSAHVQGQQPWDHLPILSVKWSIVSVLNTN